MGATTSCGSHPLRVSRLFMCITSQSFAFHNQNFNRNSQKEKLSLFTETPDVYVRVKILFLS